MLFIALFVMLTILGELFMMASNEGGYIDVRQLCFYLYGCR